MKFLDAVGPIAISKSVWSQLLDENEKGRSVTSFQDVSLDGNDFGLVRLSLLGFCIKFLKFELVGKKIS